MSSNRTVKLAEKQTMFFFFFFSACLRENIIATALPKKWTFLPGPKGETFTEKHVAAKKRAKGGKKRQNNHKVCQYLQQHDSQISKLKGVFLPEHTPGRGDSHGGPPRVQSEGDPNFAMLWFPFTKPQRAISLIPSDLTLQHNPIF